MVLGTVQPSVSPWCPSTAMDTRRAQQGHSSVVAPLGRAAGKGSPGQQDALRWPFLAQNHLSGFFPAVLLLHPSSPFTPINHLHSFAATFEELVTIGLEFCIPPTLGCPAVWIFPFSLRHATPAAAEASLPPPPACGAGSAQPLPLGEQWEAGKSKGIETPPGFPVALVTFCNAFNSSAAILESGSSEDEEEEEEEDEESAMVQVSRTGSFSVLFSPPAPVTPR